MTLHICNCIVQGPAIEDTRKILVLGNSFTFYFATFQMLQDIARSQGHDLCIRTNQEPGASFAQHLNFALTNDVVVEGGYDAAILQDRSTNHADYIRKGQKEVSDKTKELVTLVRSSSPDCRILLENTWAYEKEDCMGFGTLEAFNDALEKGCREVAEASACDVSPIAEAFAAADKEGIQMYYPDKHHQSEYGSYLKACVNYLMLYGEGFENGVSDCGISPAVAERLRNIAEEIVL